jgi:ArsR family transcriptional regulator
MLIVVDLALHERPELAERLAHRWPGFSDETMSLLLTGAGLSLGERITVPGSMRMTIWPAHRPFPAEPSSPMLAQTSA